MKNLFIFVLLVLTPTINPASLSEMITGFDQLPLSENSKEVCSEENINNITLLSEFVDTLLINGKAPIYDKYAKQYLHPISQEFIESPSYRASIRIQFKKSGTYEFKIDNNIIESYFEFKNFHKGKTYTLSVYKDNRLIASTPITFTFLPIIEINGTYFNTSDFLPGSIRVNDPDKAGKDTLIYASYRYRGATASTKKKKSYAIKLTNASGESIDQSFLNMRSDNYWILDAMAIDVARMRNRVSTDLWNDYSTKPYYFENEPQAINGTRGRFVEVILNGEYAGIYCMTERLDRKQLKLKKIQKEETSQALPILRGVLYKSSQWSYSVMMGLDASNRNYPYTLPIMYNNQKDTWDNWEMQYPDVNDGEPIDWKPLYDAISLVAAEKNLRIFRSSIDTYFDLPVFLDYYLLIELLFATDNNGKNMFIHNYNILSSPKMSVSPWDLDGTWGRRWDGSTNIVENASLDLKTYLWTYSNGEHALYKRLAEFNINNWNQKLANRYAELRHSYFNKDSLFRRFTNYHNLFLQSNAEQREINRWNGSDGIYMNFDTEMDYIKTWINNRLITLDRIYKYNPTGIIIPANNYEHDSSIKGDYGKIIVHSNETHHINIIPLNGTNIKRLEIKEGITEIHNIMPGLYIVNGKKILVK